VAHLCRISVVPLVLFCLALTACRQTPASPVDVTLAHDKGNIPLFQENFLKQGDMARKAIGVGIRPVPSVTPDLYWHQMMANLPTDQAPELFVWWSTFRARELVEHGFVTDLTALWDKYADDYAPEIREAFTVNGRVYGFPYVVEYWPVWYNKRIFKRLGLKAPTTWNEFIAVCERLKKAKVTPILCSLQNNWPAFIWFEEMIIGEDPDLYQDLCLGRVKYTDPRVVKACMVWKEMIDKGYFTDPSVNMLTNAGYLWNNEVYGMALCGSWYYSNVLAAQGVDERDIGWFILPSHNPEAGLNIVFEVGPIFTARNATNAKSAMALADLWLSPRGNAYFATVHQSCPANRKADISHLPEVKRDLIQRIEGEKYRRLNRYWEATPAPISGAAVMKLGEFILDPNSLERVLGDIEKIAQAHWDKERP